MTLPPYPKYKDSGVPWLGDIPEHWEVRRLKHLCSKSALYGANIAAEHYCREGVRFLRTTDITEDGNLECGGVFLPPELADGYLLEDDDLLISRSGTIGRSFLYDQTLHGPCSYAGYLVRFVPTEGILPKLAFLFTKTRAFENFLQVTAISSTIENVSGAKYANCPLPVPPLPEQAAITQYLNEVDRQVKQATQAAQKLIDLLTEQRQAIIRHAVTRGLNPDAPLKPSGVPWLGDIPKHWEVRRTKLAFRSIVGGSTPSSSNESYWDGQIAWVTPADISKTDRIKDSQRRITQEGLDSCSAELLPPGTLIVTSRAPVGNVALAEISLCTNQGCKSLAPDKDTTHPTFGLYMFSILQEELQNLSNGTTFMELSSQELGDLPLPLPPLPEQTAIVEHLDRATADIDAAIACAEREADLLDKYRTRLIADVVTGKADVRDTAPQIPVHAG